jgi:hypothetical protein
MKQKPKRKNEDVRSRWTHIVIGVGLVVMMTEPSPQE